MEETPIHKSGDETSQAVPKTEISLLQKADYLIGEVSDHKSSTESELNGGPADLTDSESTKSPPSSAIDEETLSGSTSEDKIDGNFEEDNDGEPIPSGTGIVSKDCTASELIGWSEILPKWHARLDQRPRGLSNLVRLGIPEPLRGEVWQLLCESQQSVHLMDQYPLLLGQSAPTEQIILRDVHRTYPAHESFRINASGSLLDSLFKVCKAYAVYDDEVGYCQGLSFLVASLLLHMPEEQAFCVFARIMQHYGLRNLFRNNFDELYLKFYQLEHLLEDQIPDLHKHFARLGIEPFMYASQWFLTVFTAKFPLNAVFYIMDIFLMDGMNTIFQVALALLISSKNELLQLDFEGVLKYFRVQMPKRYRDQENVKKLMKSLADISLKRLKKHAKSYEIEKQKEKMNEDPVTRLQRENAKLTENNLRLEQENDDLARELVSSKILLRSQMDRIEDKNDTLSRSLLSTQQDCKNYLTTISDMEDEKARLEVEVNQLKEVCRRELQRLEGESKRDKLIIQDYKQTCSQLSNRHGEYSKEIGRFIGEFKDILNASFTMNNCDISLVTQFETEADDLMIRLNFNDGDSRKNREKSNSDVDSSSAISSEESNESTKGSGKRVGAYLYSDNHSNMGNEAKIQQLSDHVDKLEVELARTKVALVEAECKCQQLSHDLNSGVSAKPRGSSTSDTRKKLESVKAAATRRMLSMVNVDILS